jgi:hypothetical protein
VAVRGGWVEEGLPLGLNLSMPGAPMNGPRADEGEVVEKQAFVHSLRSGSQKPLARASASKGGDWTQPPQGDRLLIRQARRADLQWA